MLRVNGLDPSTPEHALAAYGQLRRAERLAVEIERAGAARTLHYWVQ